MSSSISPLRFAFTSVATIAIPTTSWYFSAQQSRAEHFSKLEETSLPDSVVTISDMYVDAAEPGDVVAFVTTTERK